MLYDPTIPLLGIYLDNILIWKDTFTPVFIAALFTIAKTWKQPKCPLTEEQTKKICVCACIRWHTHTHTHTQRNTTLPWKEWNNAICNNMAGPGDYHTKAKSERERHTIYHLYVKSKIEHKWTNLWNKNRLTNIENRLVAAKA